jgi:hypothetical protein
MFTRTQGAASANGRDAERRRYPWLLGVTLATALCVVYVVQVALNWSDLANRVLYANLGMIPIGVAATIVARSAALSQTDSRSRWAWRLMGAGFGCLCAGDILFFIYQNVLGRSPFPSLADAGYLVYYPLMLAGLLFLPLRQEQRRRTGIRVAAFLVPLLGGGVAILEFLLLPTIQSWSGERFAYALSVGYPVGDLLLLAGLAWIFVRSVAGRRATMLLLTSGVVVGLMADIIYGYQNIQGTSRPGGLSDALYMASWAFYAWASYAEATRRRAVAGGGT